MTAVPLLETDRAVLLAARRRAALRRDRRHRSGVRMVAMLTAAGAGVSPRNATPAR